MDNGLEILNPDSCAEVGRWCKSPQVPDRCDRCWDENSFEHYPAEGYYNEDGYRYGTCKRCESYHTAKGRKIIAIVEGIKNAKFS